MGKLSGRVVILTGAGRGLGHGVARRFVQHGATVVAVSRTVSELEDLARAAESLDADGSLTTFPADLSQPREIERLAGDVLDRFGRVDSLINNAGILRNAPLVEVDDDDFLETLSVNLLAPVRLTRRLLPSMIAQGSGSVVNVSSRSGVMGFAKQTAYCTSKWGIEGFSYSLAPEVQPHNISVNLMTPGYRIKPTSVTAAEFEAWSEEQKAQFHDPIDMGDGFAFLALQDGQGVTGKRFDAFALSEQVRTEGWDWRSWSSIPEWRPGATSSRGQSPV
jgi:NAD(P)-dependent dehydrogenase (short-subunit alcohol dehydrogenase family)